MKIRFLLPDSLCEFIKKWQSHSETFKNHRMTLSRAEVASDEFHNLMHHVAKFFRDDSAYIPAIGLELAIQWLIVIRTRSVYPSLYLDKKEFLELVRDSVVAIFEHASSFTNKMHKKTLNIVHCELHYHYVTFGLIPPPLPFIGIDKRTKWILAERRTIEFTLRDWGKVFRRPSIGSICYQEIVAVVNPEVGATDTVVKQDTDKTMKHLSHAVQFYYERQAIRKMEFSSREFKAAVKSAEQFFGCKDNYDETGMGKAILLVDAIMFRHKRTRSRLEERIVLKRLRKSLSSILQRCRLYAKEHEIQKLTAAYIDLYPRYLSHDLNPPERPTLHARFKLMDLQSIPRNDVSTAEVMPDDQVIQQTKPYVPSRLRY